jgi:hypothetical protein
MTTRRRRASTGERSRRRTGDLPAVDAAAAAQSACLVVAIAPPRLCFDSYLCCASQEAAECSAESKSSGTFLFISPMFDRLTRFHVAEVTR